MEELVTITWPEFLLIAGTEAGLTQVSRVLRLPPPRWRCPARRHYTPVLPRAARPGTRQGLGLRHYQTLY